MQHRTSRYPRRCPLTVPMEVYRAEENRRRFWFGLALSIGIAFLICMYAFALQLHETQARNEQLITTLNSAGVFVPDGR